MYVLVTYLNNNVVDCCCTVMKSRSEKGSYDELTVTLLNRHLSNLTISPSNLTMLQIVHPEAK